MPAPATTETSAELRLAEAVAGYYDDPLGYAYFAFPWGKKGTFLEHHEGPCPCQIKLLTILRDEVRKRAFDGHTPVRPIRIAVSSGHGIGKSAFFGMVTDWIRATRKDSIGSATANTITQLDTKTWAAILRWQKMSIVAHWFDATTERVYRKNQRESWFLGRQSSDETNSEAFAGQHAQSSTSYYINDECSGIPDKIFEVQEGGLTDGEPMQFAFGNPTQPTGKFARIMRGVEPGNWIRVTIDSRECPLTNKEEIQDWIDAYGEDSDFVRVRVRGLPPRAATSQFIADDLVNEAMKRPPRCLHDDPLVVGVDFAWGGDDNNTVRFRKGADAKSIPPIYVPGELTRKPEIMVQVLSEVLSKTYTVGAWSGKIAMLFMDSAGIAGPVAIRLRELGFRNLVEVNFNAQSVDPKYKNVRAMIHDKTRQWLSHGSIDRCPALIEDCQAVRVLKHVPLLLIPKEAIIKELGHSTDDLDALSLTHYMHVPSEQSKNQREQRRKQNASRVGSWT